MSSKKRHVPTQAQSATLCAMQANADKDGFCKLGLLTQITPHFPIEVCGEGFNEKTIRVRVQGQFYFVFREDLRAHAV